MHEDIKSVLFLCTGNSCRSQMAEGWAKHIHGKSLDIYSAGIETHGLNPYAVKVMKEAGVDISKQRSELVDDYVEWEFDLVVTVCGAANETCPRFPGDTRVEHVPFDDPPILAEGLTDEEEKMDCFRRVRDEIKSYVETLPEVLNAGKD